MSKDIFKQTGPSATPEDPQRTCQKVHMPTVQQVIQHKKQSEDPHSHSHWGETAQVHNV